MASSKGDSPTPAQPGLIRSLNNRVVLDLLIEHGSLSRSEVHTLTGLSKPTASQLLARLEESGLVLQSGLGKIGPGGRAPKLYRIEPDSGHAAAVNVRRERIHVRIANITGAVIAERVIEIAADEGGPDATAAAIRDCCGEAGLETDQLDSIVIGLPGSYDADADSLHYVDHVVGWSDPTAGAQLRALFPSAKLAIENDVNLAAIAEQRATGSGSEDFFLFWLDDGVGGAIMVGDTLLRGSRGAAGEAAFLYTPGAVIDPVSRAAGALEQLLGPDALIELAGAKSTAGSGTAHSEKEIIEAMLALVNDANAASALTEFARRCALALASVIALLDPARLVLGGELARVGGERLRAEVTQQLEALVLTTPPLVLAASSDNGSPILDGAMSMSLETARDRVFTT